MGEVKRNEEPSHEIAAFIAGVMGTIISLYVFSGEFYIIKRIEVPKFIVGECIREMGFEEIAKITYVSDSFVEYKWLNSASRMSVSTIDSDKLIKVECPKK